MFRKCEHCNGKGYKITGCTAHGPPDMPAQFKDWEITTEDCKVCNGTGYKEIIEKDLRKGNY